MLSQQLNDLPGSMDSAEANPGTPQKRTASYSPSKARSLSDGGGPPQLSPSPKFREPEKPRQAKDDSSLDDSPSTPRRPSFPRGLSLQMPARDLMSPNTSAYIHRIPLSPKLDHSQTQTYGSPTSVLPRRSRGLDFSRAATNLHHSTLAESSPDSSPTITGRAMNIPNWKNGSHGSADSLSNNQSSLWSTMANNTERMNISSSLGHSLGSVSMLMGSDSSSSSDDDDVMMDDDIDDSILTTPHMGKTSFGLFPQPSPGDGWMKQPAASRLMDFRRKNLHGKGRKGSSSLSMAKPSSKSPPILRSIESMGSSIRENTIGDGLQGRRESISWHAKQLHISGSESDDGTLKSTLENPDNMPVTPGRDGQRGGVVRRTVTRRGNMLPKTKGFARIQAALAEESAPVETEVNREAEVVRQTRESDMDLEPRHHSISTTQSSPTMGPQESLEGIPEDESMMDISSNLSSSFKQHAILNSKGKEFWDSFKDDSHRTPPPPSFIHRGSSSGNGDDMSLDSPSISTPPLFSQNSTVSERRTSSPSRSATPQPKSGPTPAEITQKVNNKRRRDDDFDPTSFKRRAVSPGMSVHNSPVMQSPMQRESWGHRPPSVGDLKAHANGGTKRVGFQGMVDTNDGLSNMSIE